MTYVSSMISPPFVTINSTKINIRLVQFVNFLQILKGIWNDTPIIYLSKAICDNHSILNCTRKVNLKGCSPIHDSRKIGECERFEKTRTTCDIPYKHLFVTSPPQTKQKKMTNAIGANFDWCELIIDLQYWIHLKGVYLVPVYFH